MKLLPNSLAQLIRTRRFTSLLLMLALLVGTIWLFSPDKIFEYEDPDNQHLAFLRKKYKETHHVPGFEDLPLTRENREKIRKREALIYRLRARYPAWSQPIPIHQGRAVDPLEQDGTPLPAKKSNPGSSTGYSLFHVMERSSYQPGEKVVIHAWLTDREGQKLETDRLKATLQDRGGKKAKIRIQKMMTDSGGYHDQPDDKIYTAVFPTKDLTKRPWNYLLVLTYDVKEADLIEVTNGFTFGALNISATGEFTEEQFSDEKGTHLVIGMETDVEKAGTYYGQASLYTPGGKPVAMAKTREKLEAGKQWLNFRFHGVHFCESKEDGPYLLKYAMLYNVKAMPNPRSPLLKDLYTTLPYSYKDFTCEPFKDQNFLDKARAIEGRN